MSLDVHPGEFISIAGPSGSGKTTLLNLIGCVDAPPRQGRGRRAGHRQLSERAADRLRLNTIGFIFQSFNLVPVLSVFQNVELPLLLQRKLRGPSARARVHELLEQVGLARLRQPPPQRAFRRPAPAGGDRPGAGDPAELVLADEPTANLDSVTGENIIDLMKEMNQLREDHLHLLHPRRAR